MCACTLMHVTAHWGCMDTVRESALRVDSGRKKPLAAPGTRTCISIAFKWDALPTESVCLCCRRRWGRLLAVGAGCCSG